MLKLGACWGRRCSFSRLNVQPLKFLKLYLKNSFAAGSDDFK
jgi:hypothetical protein